MFIVFDEDIPRSFAPIFIKHGFQILDIRDEGLRGSKDEEVITFAVKKNAALMTGDLRLLRLVRKNFEPQGFLLNRLPQNISLHRRLQELDSLLQFIKPSDVLRHIIVFEIGRIRKRPL